MRNLEEELKSALARRNAPDGFAERVLARISQREARPHRRWLAAAAAVVVLMSAGLVEHQRRQRAEAETASRELVRAIEIVNVQLEQARQRVIDTGDIQWDLERKSLRP